MRKSKLRHIGISALSCVLVSSAIYCMYVHISGMDIPSIDIIAAELTMPTGNAEYSEASEDTSDDVSVEEISEIISEVISQTSQEESDSADESQISEYVFESSTASEAEIQKYIEENEGKTQYPITEITITDGNVSYGNVQVKNTSSTTIDIEEELNSELGFVIEDTDEPQVLIYHTHTCESFLTYDTGYFYEGFYPRTTDNTQNVCAVGEEIAKKLNSEGIVTIHDTTMHDSPSYSGAYDRSLATINDYLEQYPSIKVVIDIHRDGIGTDTEKSKPVFTMNGKKVAQIMILAGYQYDDSLDFSDWEYNLRFALQIQSTAESMYPNMMRPVYFSDFMYNMNVNTGSLLIEIGAESNTLEEVRYSGYLLGEVLAEVLKNNMSGQ